MNVENESLRSTSCGQAQYESVLGLEQAEKDQAESGDVDAHEDEDEEKVNDYHVLEAC
jgi:hypothetical protein